MSIMFKKVFAFVLALTLCFCLVACGNEKQQENINKKSVSISDNKGFRHIPTENKIQ